MKHCAAPVMLLLVVLAMLPRSGAPQDQARAESAGNGPDYISVRDARLLPPRLPVERVSVGEVGDYKPCLVNLIADELLLVCYRANVEGLPGRQYRSFDGGRTWNGAEPGVDGGEPFTQRLTDGSLLVYNHRRRSEDNGRSWVECLPPQDLVTSVVLSRNALELADGALLDMVGRDYEAGEDYVARSTDGGRTWPELYPIEVEGVPEGSWSVFGEAHLCQARSEKLYAVCRVDHRQFPLPGQVLGNLELASLACSLFQYGLAPVRSIAECDLDQANRLKVFSSADLGRTWQPGPDLGDYGSMYPHILRLQDGRLLFIFTRRSFDPPLGVRAILGTEQEDGFEFDCQHDLIMIDTKTPIGRGSGGGFGNTIQLDDGTLVTAYSYWPEEDKRAPNDWPLPNPSRCEVARWRLPTPE